MVATLLFLGFVAGVGVGVVFGVAAPSENTTLVQENKELAAEIERCRQEVELQRAEYESEQVSYAAALRAASKEA